MEKLFLLLLITQMLAYGIVDHFKIKYGRLIVLSLFLSLFLILFPIYFKIDDETEKNSIFCFYNTFAYFQVYWNIGVIIVLASHFTYCYLLNRKPRKNN
jgi:hypothetical protein